MRGGRDGRVMAANPKDRDNDADEDLVMKAIKGLERTDLAEYRALKELFGDEGGCSLGRLPLALVQPETYMARFECSIANYLNMLMNASRTEYMQYIM